MGTESTVISMSKVREQYLDFIAKLYFEGWDAQANHEPFNEFKHQAWQDGYGDSYAYNEAMSSREARDFFEGDLA